MKTIKFKDLESYRVVEKELREQNEPFILIIEDIDRCVKENDEFEILNLLDGFNSHD